MQTLQAVELVRHEPSRAVKLEYGGTMYSGIRVCRRRQKEITHVELSRVDGVVGELSAKVITIKADEIGSIPDASGATRPKRRR